MQIYSSIGVPRRLVESRHIYMKFRVNRFNNVPHQIPFDPPEINWRKYVWNMSPICKLCWENIINHERRKIVIWTLFLGSGREIQRSLWSLIFIFICFSLFEDFFFNKKCWASEVEFCVQFLKNIHFYLNWDIIEFPIHAQIPYITPCRSNKSGKLINPRDTTSFPRNWRNCFED